MRAVRAWLPIRLSLCQGKTTELSLSVSARRRGPGGPAGVAVLGRRRDAFHAGAVSADPPSGVPSTTWTSPEAADAGRVTVVASATAAAAARQSQARRAIGIRMRPPRRRRSACALALQGRAARPMYVAHLRLRLVVHAPYRTAQLYVRDVPLLRPPGRTDLLQILWCPSEHPPEYKPPVKLFWRTAADGTDVLTAPPQPYDADEDFYVPQPCVLAPEEVIEYPDFLELPEELRRQLLVPDLWEAAGVDLGNFREAPQELYDVDLSHAPGWKIGGWAPRVRRQSPAAVRLPGVRGHGPPAYRPRAVTQPARAPGRAGRGSATSAPGPHGPNGASRRLGLRPAGGSAKVCARHRKPPGLPARTAEAG
ncbi:hypothetical protein SLAV_02015 [Streptomyces lavendulae subsp. lavendulae]|uniref:Uncharacterized protein n=1 Tax=Streptomyces lavendulae subsp. lavendulae TaxID=58340 RepID=A0A2K8P6F4_STRLA|nr:hypothetical protein SLAV_02015 [Streptomyces lavendulae subsp. lavendulae]QUQ52171.1 hypothetical protein SLLC_00045 [Streptomyces lavendulae subsp. lavendulae]